MKCLLTVLGNQDPKKTAGGDGPILSIFSELEPIDLLPDLVAVVCVHSEGGVNQEANRTRLQRLQDLQTELKARYANLQFAEEIVEANPASIDEMESKMEVAVLELLARRPWTDTLVYVSPGPFAVQQSLFDLAQWSIVPNPHVVQRLEESGAVKVDARRRTQQAFFERFCRAMELASFHEASRAANELANVTSGYAKNLSEVLAHWAGALAALDEGDIKVAHDRANLCVFGAPPQMAAQIVAQAHWIKCVDDLVRRPGRPWEKPLGLFLEMYPTLSWKDAAGQPASRLTRSRNVLEQLARIEALLILNAQPEIANTHPVREPTPGIMGGANWERDVNRSTGGALRKWMQGLREADAVRQGEVEFSLLGRILRLQWPTGAGEADDFREVLNELNNTFELHAGPPWAPGKDELLSEALTHHIVALIGSFQDSADCPVGMNAIRQVIADLRPEWPQILVRSAAAG